MTTLSIRVDKFKGYFTGTKVAESINEEVAKSYKNSAMHSNFPKHPLTSILEVLGWFRVLMK